MGFVAQNNYLHLPNCPHPTPTPASEISSSPLPVRPGPRKKPPTLYEPSEDSWFGKQLYGTKIFSADLFSTLYNLISVLFTLWYLHSVPQATGRNKHHLKSNLGSKYTSPRVEIKGKVVVNS
uniref:Uncharacterized protein n=1 Tax=Pipistrellus kuhlii TaxID=59472 RepID=A0A7J7VML4_PIPKU|nr:hypothetical protein mPipKuh1_008419 [Pipistrellus kuhlii]